MIVVRAVLALSPVANFVFGAVYLFGGRFELGIVYLGLSLSGAYIATHPSLLRPPLRRP